MNGDDNPLAAQALAQCTAGGSMRGDERRRGSFTQLPLFCGVFQCQPGELVRLLGGKLSACSDACAGIRYGRQSSAPIGKSPDNERDGAGMSTSKRGIDRTNDLTSGGTLCSGKQLQFGRMN